MTASAGSWEATWKGFQCQCAPFAGGHRGTKRQTAALRAGSSNTAKRGNSTSKLPEETAALMAEFINNDYETPKQKRKQMSWMALRLECEKRGITAPSYKTFSRAIRNRSGFEQALKRLGHRAAYEQEPFYWRLEQTTPRHGIRPFEIGHIGPHRTGH